MKIPKTPPHDIPAARPTQAEAIVDEVDQAMLQAALASAQQPRDGRLATPRLATVPDAGAAELLAPVTAAAPTPPAVPDTAAPNATTPTATGDPDYPDQPDDLPSAISPPVDPAAERAAWVQLMAFINAHKDTGTVVEAADPDAFMHGLD